jgi:hypothetical protein
MALEETIMDERGRVTIGKSVGAKYGRRFFVVQLSNEIILIPKPQDPVKELQEWGRKAKIGNLTAQEIGKLAEEEAYKEIRQREKRRREGR